jgi:hypothetical protein
MITLLWLAACSGETSLPVVPPAPVWVDAQHVDAGAHITLHAPVGATVASTGSLVVAPSGDGTWDLSGENGSYIVTVTPPAPAAAPAGSPAPAPTRLFVDVGVAGPTGGEMDDLADLPPPPPPIWPWVVAGVAAVVVAGGGAAWAWQRFKPVPAPPPPDPPEVVARRAWAALRERTDLRPEEIARAMSEIFRTWVDAAWGFPATRRTTREILDNLAGAFTAAELDAARRLLMATDLVKFAERSEHANLFENLDRDFSTLVRPVRRA